MLSNLRLPTGRLELVIKSALLLSRTKKGTLFPGPPNWVNNFSPPGVLSLGSPPYCSATVNRVTMKYFSITDRFVGSFRNKSSRLHGPHHDAPKTRKRPFCSVLAFFFAAGKMVSATVT